MDEIRQRLMLITGYLGAVIGAGFASGQEIVQFFVNYGNYGMKGVILATILFAVCGGLLLYLAHNHKIANYQDMLQYLLGYRLGRVVDFLLALFLFLGISTMLSASGAVFYEHLYLPKMLGIFLAYAVIVILLITGKKGLILSYNVLVPVKILLLLIISGYAAIFLQGNQFESITYTLGEEYGRSWMIASILYVAYNFALALVVLTEYQTITNRHNGIVGAVLGGLILGMLVIVNYISLSKFLPTILHYEVPMLFIAGNISLTAKHIYTLVLWLGILTTAIANTYGFAQRFSRFTGLNYGLCLIVCMTMALPLSMQSFSSLVSIIYPIFGLLGISIIASLIYWTVKEIAGELYYRITAFLNRHKEG
ncbi:MAG: hypothetical protein PHF24_02885 [Syntrophomonas sp.]|nr:hypothetical protein [Syntrophomonas sp.]